MRNLWVVLAAVCMFYSIRTEAAVTDYSGDETGFNSAIAGLGTLLIDFDDLTLGDVIYDQYNPPVRFLTNDGFDITANHTGWGTPALSEYPSGSSSGLCAQLPHEDSGGPPIVFGDLQFSQPVLGVSLWVLDVRPEGLNISVFDKDDILLSPTLWVGSGGLYTYVGLLCDAKEIGRVRVETIWAYDGIAFDDVTVVPEPTTVSLLVLGGLGLLRKRKA